MCVCISALRLSSLMLKLVLHAPPAPNTAEQQNKHTEMLKYQYDSISVIISPAQNCKLQKYECTHTAVQWFLWARLWRAL